MGSKYDEYWTARLAELADAIAEAAMGMPAIIRVSDLVNLGKRESWYGTATVSGGDVLQGDMAHLVSLAKIVAHHQLCGSATFRLTVRNDLTLAIHLVEEAAGSSRPRQPRSIVSSKVTVEVPESQETTAEAACGRIHNLLEGLPLLDRPDDIPFDDGLYFFYERSETTAHTNAQRVVRVGNHPRAAARLKPRLRDHYRSSRGAKNGSVFRRYLGGALLRRSEAASPCLAPGPGAGHWERQNEPACSACTPVEQLVTSTLLERFTLRAIRIEDMAERNAFEALLIATIAACPVCRPSGGWLGQFAYPRSIQQTGLWNTEFVGRPSMDHSDLMRFRQLVLASGGKEPLMGDLAKTLLVIPCSGGKKGNRTLDLPPISIVDLVDADKGRLLEEGRRLDGMT